MLLLDEPSCALDAQVRRESRRWLREIHDRTGHTTVFVTPMTRRRHWNSPTAIAVMSQGRIEQVGTADEGSRYAQLIVRVRVLLADLRRFRFLSRTASSGWTIVRLVCLLRVASLRKAALHFRPGDVELLEGEAQACWNSGRTARRVAGSFKQCRTEIGGGQHRVEIELPAAHPAANASRIAFDQHAGSCSRLKRSRSPYRSAPTESLPYCKRRVCRRLLPDAALTGIGRRGAWA